MILRISKKSIGWMVAGLLGGLASQSAFADQLIDPSGVAAQANFGGYVVVSASQSTPGIFFSNSSNTVNNVFDPSLPDTGSYSGLTAGTIKNLLTPMTATGPDFIADYLTFTTSAGTIHFDLESIRPGTGTYANCTNAMGVVCTPPGSPFSLTQTSVSDPNSGTTNTVAIALVLVGDAYTGSKANGYSPTTVTFTTQNAVPGTETAILNTLQSGGSVNDSYSAVVASSATPEPGTLTMLFTGMAMLGLGAAGRKRIRNNQ